jgi:flagellar assembly factor FliW
MTSAALAYSMPVAPVTVHSDLLGSLSVQPDAIFTFSRGLLGFPECRQFVLLPSEREHVYWLQSVEYPTLAFLLIDPFVFFPGYTVDLATSDLGKVATSPHEVMVLAIVTLPGTHSTTPTANLQGPVVLNTSTQQGYQAVFSDVQYGIREAFAL